MSLSNSRYCLREAPSRMIKGEAVTLYSSVLLFRLVISIQKNGKRANSIRGNTRKRSSPKPRIGC